MYNLKEINDVQESSMLKAEVINLDLGGGRVLVIKDSNTINTPVPQLSAMNGPIATQDKTGKEIEFNKKAVKNKKAEIKLSDKSAEKKIAILTFINAVNKIYSKFTAPLKVSDAKLDLVQEVLPNTTARIKVVKDAAPETEIESEEFKYTEDVVKSIISSKFINSIYLHLFICY